MSWDDFANVKKEMCFPAGFESFGRYYRAYAETQSVSWEGFEKLHCVAMQNMKSKFTSVKESAKSTVALSVSAMLPKFKWYTASLTLHTLWLCCIEMASRRYYWINTRRFCLKTLLFKNSFKYKWNNIFVISVEQNNSDCTCISIAFLRSKLCIECANGRMKPQGARKLCKNLKINRKTKQCTHFMWAVRSALQVQCSPVQSNTSFTESWWPYKFRERPFYCYKHFPRKMFFV